jgi:hypothetical protein
MYTVDRDEYAEKLFLYSSVDHGVCGQIHVKIDRNSTASKKVQLWSCDHQNEAKWQLQIAVYVIKSLIIRLKGNDLIELK